MKTTKAYLISMSDKTNDLLNDLARQSFRTRSGMIEYLLDQERARQIEAVNKLPAVEVEKDAQ